MKSKWKKRDEKIKQETLKKKIKEEEKERLERERTEKAIALRKKNARIPHYGGVISTNKNIAMKKFLLRKMSTGTSTMSVTQMEASVFHWGYAVFRFGSAPLPIGLRRGGYPLGGTLHFPLP